MAPVKVAILLSAAAVAKSTPWAFGNSEMRYEEKGQCRDEQDRNEKVSNEEDVKCVT